jgi:uncharacterized repeat protein (TIGR02543 family)
MKRNIYCIAMFFLAIVLVSQYSGAQTVLISNLTKSIDAQYNAGGDTWIAQAFTTDSSPSRLDSVICKFQSGAADASLKLYGSSSGNVGSFIANFGAGTLVSGSDYRFVPSTTVDLAASTTYWIVLSSSNQTYWHATSDQTYTGTGTIPTDKCAADSLDGGVTWSPYYPITAYPYMFEVRIYDRYSVTFQTDGTAGASLTGTTSQLVSSGGNCTAVTANAPVGYYFVNWTGTGGFTSTDNPVTVTNVTQNMTITANFAVSQYTVTFQTDGTPGATLTGTTPQTVLYGGNCTAVTANVPTGYSFVNWTGTGGFTSTANPVTVTNVTQNMTITANYAINQYTVTFQTDGTPGATLTGTTSQTVNHGSNCTAVTANIPVGYSFFNWTGTGGFTSTANPVTVTNVTQNMTITANYTINQYTVNFQTDGTAGSSLTGTTSQTVNYGSNCTAVTANAPVNYHFVNWTGTGGFTSTDNPVTVTNVTQDMTITANFAIDQYTVTFQTDGTPGATLTGTTSQTVNYGANCTAVTANIPVGYSFVNWTGTSGFTSTDNPVTVTNVTQNLTITANYAINQYTVTFQTDGTPGATLTGSTSQTVNYGANCTAVTANVPTGYSFVNWTGTGGFTSTDNPVTVTNVTQNMTITANYAINQYTVTFQTDGTPGATLTGTTSQIVNHGSNCTAVTANVPTGYSFVNWTGTGGFTSNANPVTVTNVTQNMTITANYAINQYTVTFQTDGTPGATLTGSTSQTVNHGANCTAVTANAPTGYSFVNWTGTGGFTSTDNPVTVTNVTQNMTITANFAINQYTVTFQTDGTAGATLTGTLTQIVNHGSNCTAVTANAPVGYHLVNWTGTGGFTDTANPVTVTNVIQNMTITANFAPNQYLVTFQTDGTPGAALTGTLSQMVNHGANCTAVTANAPTGYHFVNWTSNIDFISTDNPLTVTNVVQDMTLTANFAINQYTVTFQTDGTPGATLTGSTSQTVNHGSNCTAVTANAPTGYHLVDWTGTGGFTSTANPVTVTNVTQNMTITANFAINQYTVTFQTDGTAGATLTGSTSQTINHGANCTPVTANAPTNYHFVNWTGTGGFTSTDNPVTVTNVTQNMTITANFALDQYTVTFQTDGTAGATITGSTSQTVNYGANCTAVTANAPTGYHLVNWTGTGGFTSTDNPVTVTNVTQNMTITANFAINQYTVTFQTDGTAGATLTGTTSQTVNHGANCTAVTANAPAGYHLVNWTGTGGFTSTANPLTVTNVTQNMTITANFSTNTFTISGTVTVGSNPLQGVTISFSYNGHTESTDALGNYSYKVKAGVDTSVTPSKPGYSFTPTEYTYTNLSENKLHQDFTAEPTAFTVTITEPQDGAQVSGIVTIKATASSTLTSIKSAALSTITRVEFHIDGVKLAEDTTEPYETTWDTTAAGEGTHTIKAVAYNAENQSSQAVITVIVSNASPELMVNRTRLNFGSTPGAGGTSSRTASAGFTTGEQSILINNTGGGTLHWTVSRDADWITCTPLSGTDAGIVAVSVNPASLPKGTYTGTITIQAPGAANSPVTIPVTLQIYSESSTVSPFGYFETPVEGTTIMSSVPVTGWVLDDIEVVSVKIYRESIPGHEPDGLVFIGDAVFVDGARPDVEQSFPTYPQNYQAGWGYMMLTNFLPFQGNGTFTIYALARDKEGHEVTLGSKTIVVDNAHAVKPFGALDTPSQGGIASGSAYVNFGWALAPLPNTIPGDGSTLIVWLNGVPVGSPVYGHYREDVATLFPSCNNSSAAGGYFYLDTTPYLNGVHTISWSVKDSAGNQDGIGSRFFTIQNIDGVGLNKTASKQYSQGPGVSMLRQASISFQPVLMKKGYEINALSEAVYPDNEGVIAIDLKEDERLEVLLKSDDPLAAVSGYAVIGNRLQMLPVGSTLDRVRGIFYWQPGAGFFGEYSFVFIEKSVDGQFTKKVIKVVIHPKY